MHNVGWSLEKIRVRETHIREVSDSQQGLSKAQIAEINRPPSRRPSAPHRPPRRRGGSLRRREAECEAPQICHHLSDSKQFILL